MKKTRVTSYSVTIYYHVLVNLSSINYVDELYFKLFNGKKVINAIE